LSTLTSRQDEAEGAVDIELSYREAINLALSEEMAADPSVVLLGEDVGAAGGVFKTNESLPERFPGRVINTPICENGFTGVALGMALMGLRPVVEFMFSDFLPTAGDQIVNQLPKYRFMSGGQCSVPVTIRSISGGTGRFGTQHSATGESWFMGLPGLRVCTASSPGAAYDLLRAAIRHNNPVIFHEHKGLYGRKGIVRKGGPPAVLGRAAVVREGRDLTVVATMLMVERALAAASVLETEGISIEVIDLRWVRPLDLPTIVASVGRTGRLLIAEEQVHAGGWGATVISELAMAAVAMRAAPRAVSMPPDICVSYSPPLEDAILPSADAIAEAARGSVKK
jgi:pyruvate/2-oxoglutarate/acetoin dehydrogenase E1 component